MKFYLDLFMIFFWTFEALFAIDDFEKLDYGKFNDV
jgi:hypothetical protein